MGPARVTSCPEWALGAPLSSEMSLLFAAEFWILVRMAEGLSLREGQKVELHKHTPETEEAQCIKWGLSLIPITYAKYRVWQGVP